MVILSSPKGEVLADVTGRIEDLVTWMGSTPDKPRWRFTQEGGVGQVILKDLPSVQRVKEFLSADLEEIR